MNTQPVSAPVSAPDRTLSARRSVVRAAALAGLTVAGLTTTAPRRAAAAVPTDRSGRPLVAPATTEVEPVRLHVPESQLKDLRDRLAGTRLPSPAPVTDWSQGAPADQVGALVQHWRRRYDWRVLERRINDLGHFRTSVDGLGIHFLHVRSKHPDALPVILTHGWPGSVVEFLDTIGPLVDPTAHGGTPQQAFHVVVPSLPGFGLSDRPTEPGWGLPRIAEAWDVLMHRLGYDRYVAQGGDWGAGVTTWMGKQRPAGLLGIHLNLPILFAPPPLAGATTPAEDAALAALTRYGTTESAYAALQATRPQTIGYALADSPVGQAAWIYEKLGAWSDTHEQPAQVLGPDRVLDNIAWYWMTDTGASSARLYAESFGDDFVTIKLDLPVGVSVFPKEIYRAPKIWAERTYSDLVYFSDDIGAGGHFAAFEQPALFVSELRACFAALR
ncbi:epoxide hydrolase family protein [Pedococcus sp. KACC 23699]|uniref:Epoxide hydrolase family protein n=1 Tax=Pedococcus sp. KACC 23699 TaxID=3149228 RepID=A0AAU7JUW3_9MICO